MEIGWDFSYQSPYPPAPKNILLPERPHLLTLPKQHYQLSTLKSTQTIKLDFTYVKLHHSHQCNRRVSALNTWAFVGGGGGDAYPNHITTAQQLQFDLVYTFSKFLYFNFSVTIFRLHQISSALESVHQYLLLRIPTRQREREEREEKERGERKRKRGERKRKQG